MKKPVFRTGYIIRLDKSVNENPQQKWPKHVIVFHSNLFTNTGQLLMTSLPLMYSTAILDQVNLFFLTLMRILHFLCSLPLPASSVCFLCSLPPNFNENPPQKRNGGAPYTTHGQRSCVQEAAETEVLNTHFLDLRDIDSYHLEYEFLCEYRDIILKISQQKGRPLIFRNVSTKILLDTKQEKRKIQACEAW